MNTRGSFLEVKQPGHEVGHHLHLLLKSKSAWSCNSTTAHAFMTWYLIKRRYNFPKCPIRVHCATNVLLSSKWDLHNFCHILCDMTWLRVGLSGVRIPESAREFSLLQNVQTNSRVHPDSYSMGTGDSFPGGVKWPGREPDHPLPSIAKVKNE
jgi:hypothetical protein